MAETLSPHYSWVKPDIGGDASTWGNVLNTTIDAVDSVVYANQQAGVPIGSIQMFGGASAPGNWLICNGSSLSTTGTYAALFAVLGYAFGGSGANFNLPNLVQHFPLGAGTNPLGQAGGTFTVTLATANLPAHAHPITDVTHNHSQTSHNHSDPGHTHGVNDAVHTHSVNAVFGGGSEIAGGSGWGQHNIQSGGSVTGISIAAAGTGIQPAVANISASGTGLSTTQNVGSGAAFNVVPPFVAINFIVRYR